MPNASCPCGSGRAGEDPLELRGREVRVADEPRLRSRTSAAGSSAQRAAVRRSCQTIAGWTGRPLARSQTTVVSRWFVIPIAARSRAAIPASASAVLGGEDDARPDLLRVVLDPAGHREVLGDLAVAAAERSQLLVDDEARRAGRALVDREDHVPRTYPIEAAHEVDVDPVDELVGRGEPLVGQRAADGEAPQPGRLRRGDAGLGVLERDRLGRARRRAARARADTPSGCGLPCSTSSAATIAVSSVAIRAAATTGSISARKAPETIATGTRAAA